MTVALIRVDDRLVHGQVLMGWTQSLGVDHVLVADDPSAGDPLQKTLMGMAAPAGVRVSILTVADAAAHLVSGADGSARTLVLVRGPRELTQLRAAGVPFDFVNVGNVHTGPGRSKVTKEVHASEDELVLWRELADAGVRLEAQWVPGQSRTDLGKLVHKS